MRVRVAPSCARDLGLPYLGQCENLGTTGRAINPPPTVAVALYGDGLAALPMGWVRSRRVVGGVQTLTTSVVGLRTASAALANWKHVPRTARVKVGAAGVPVPSRFRDGQ